MSAPVLSYPCLTVNPDTGAVYPVRVGVGALPLDLPAGSMCGGIPIGAGGGGGFSGAFAALTGIPTTSSGYLGAATSGGRAIDKAIYITKRGDSRAGTGTPEDPLDATSDLHAIWSTVVAAAPSYVEFAKATYPLSDVLLPIANCWINLNGATLQCAAGFGVNNTHKSIFQGDGSDYSFCSITGGIADGNIAGQTATKSVVAFFNWSGSYNLVAGNYVKNFGSKSDNSTEVFVGGIGPINTIKAYGNVIRDNNVTAIVTANSGLATVFCLGGTNEGAIDDFTKPTDKWQHGGRITGNTFKDISGAVQCIELGSWAVGETIANNKFFHIAGTCIYIDTGSSWDASVLNNYCEDVQIGIQIVNAKSTSAPNLWENRRMRIEDNTVYPQTTSGVGYGIKVQQGDAHVNKRNIDFIVRGNRVGTYWNGTAANIGIYLSDMQGGAVENNEVDPAVASSSSVNHFGLSYADGIFLRNNTARVISSAGGLGTIYREGNFDTSFAPLDGQTTTLNNLLTAGRIDGLTANDSSAVVATTFDQRQWFDKNGVLIGDWSTNDGSGVWFTKLRVASDRDATSADSVVILDGNNPSLFRAGLKVGNYTEPGDGSLGDFNVWLKPQDSVGTPMTADRTLNIDLVNGNRSFKLADNFTINNDVALSTDGVGTRTLNIGAGGTLGGAAFASTTNPTFTGATISSGALTLSGNQSAAAWTTSGIRLVGVSGTLTDTTSSGTVATAYTNKLGGNTIAASSATTFTNYISSYFSDPVAGTNVTMTNKYALGADSAKLTTLVIGSGAAITSSGAGGALGTGAFAAAFDPTAPGAIGGVTPGTGSFTTLSNTGAATNSKSGAASVSALTLSGVPFAGTGTTSFPLLYINDANATASTTLNTAGTYFGVNGHGSQDLLRLAQDGVRLFTVNGTGGTSLNTTVDPGVGCAIFKGGVNVTATATFGGTLAGAGQLLISGGSSDVKVRLMQNGGGEMQFSSTGGLYSGSGNADGAQDVGLVRDAAGRFGIVDDDSKVNYRDLKLRAIISAGTATTCTGATIGSGSKSHAGFVTATTTGTTTCVITFPVTAPTGWNIIVNNGTTAADVLTQTASTTTTATFVGTTVSGDVIRYIAFPY